MTQPFPFYAGQRSDKTFSRGNVLSPLPVKTQIPPTQSDDSVISKTDSYLELGGYGGLVFQSQMMWTHFLLGLIVFLLLYSAGGGISGLYHAMYKEELIDGQWVNKIQYMELLAGSMMYLAGPLLWTLPLRAIYQTRKALSQVLPFRFHRQRREVMMSRWNRKTQQTEIRFFPWESVCAMVGEGSAVGAGAVMSGGNLLIAANDEDEPGYFWSSKQIGAQDLIHATAKWEMIRRFMEDGPQAIGKPQLVTFQGMIEEYCQQKQIAVQDFPNGIRWWWYLNGRLIGLWRINRARKRQSRLVDSFPEVAEWSQPLPESEWAQPSRELQAMNHILTENEYAQGLTILNVGDLREKYGSP
ncbi:hypothetical protein [Vibrio rhizosphaerae]|uniref:hypothetical protein n=1 Tax=Vibrio rhizosphaerae TaxID=398736 RepID=UPI00056F5416|nr:hypothetical protein [Vibrio rhizosphaerae]